jgi:hypothetical protein
VQTAIDTFGQQITPDTPCTVGASLAMKLDFTCRLIASSLRDLALGDRFSQVRKPDRDTTNA